MYHGLTESSVSARRMVQWDEYQARQSALGRLYQNWEEKNNNFWQRMGKGIQMGMNSDLE